MNNNEEVYYIEDIHPMDAWYPERDRWIGKKITNVVFDTNEWIEGWKGTSSFKAKDFGSIGVFLAVKVRKVEKKSFWQKLEDICMELFG